MNWAEYGNIFDYEITGSGRFPLELLPAMMAWPATREDATLLSSPTRIRSIRMAGIQDPTPGTGAMVFSHTLPEAGWIVTLIGRRTPTETARRALKK